MDHHRKNLLLFFDRPKEPIFMGKGGDTLFLIPEEYYPEEYKSLVLSLEEKATTNIFTKNSLADEKSPDISEEPEKAEENQNTPKPVKRERKPSINIPVISLPDLSLPKELSRHEHFSFILPKHRQMAAKLIDVFMKVPRLEELVGLFTYCQMHINPYLFNYSASVAILHRADTKGLDLPTFAETFPDKFVDRNTLHRAREYCAVVPENGKIPDIEIKLPVNPINPEQRMAYFREDVGVNSHHWHWHLIYPTDASDAAIVKKDRRGELFYYMHHQVLARYNVERFCNELPLCKPYDNFREPIEEAYFPLLDSGNTSRVWAPRYDNTKVYDVHRHGKGIHTSVADVETWRERFLAAAESQSILKMDGSTMPLDEETGIDILGNLVEATMISENPVYYGDYHNQGHMLIAYVHDPCEYHLQEHSVMGDTATAMRDPVFYHWHAGIDKMFTIYKDKLTPYRADKLSFRDVVVSSVSLQDARGQDTNNTISTYWQRSTMNLHNGLDYAPRRDVYARFTHLQHEEFQYVIEVLNASGRPQLGTVRIFLAPTVDESGRTLSFDEQRKLAIEMDKFSHPLPPGNNTILRNSLYSSVTIPFEQIFRDPTLNVSAKFSVNFCNCGWPQYLLVPKGTVEGYPMVLFVMVSNWNDDKVDRDLTVANNDNASYCGLRDAKYPDRRAMGFPFDRKPAPGVNSFANFVQPNMAFTNCTIKFTGRTQDRNQKTDVQTDQKPDVSEGGTTTAMEQPPTESGISDHKPVGPPDMGTMTGGQGNTD